MLTYNMDERGKKSLYGYLYERIRADIESGIIAPQQKLPSKRELAKHLGVSLITVEGAYSQLIAEGYVLAQQRRGYYACDLGACVSSIEKKPLISFNEEHEPSPRDLVFEDEKRPHVEFDFTGTSFAPGLFPYSLWAKTMRQVLSRQSEEGLLDASRAQGSYELRCAISNYLKGFRGMDAPPDQIVVGAGAQVLYQLIIQLLGRNATFAVEDPGYSRLSSIYAANDVSVQHVSLDASGISMAGLRASGAQVLHCMPSHQYPTGLVTSIARRREVLEWAVEAPGRYIIEDDYDCEFRLAGRPIPSLQSIDTSERVIYANTFTRSLGASFRFGYMVLPPHLAKQFKSKLGFYSNTVSALDQLALAEFMRSGCYERHVNRLRSHYRKVQQALLDSFHAYPQFIPEALDSGLHFILGVMLEGKKENPTAFESRIEHLACKRGISIRSLSGYRQLVPKTTDSVEAPTAFANSTRSTDQLPSIQGMKSRGPKMARFVICLTGITLEVAEYAGEALARLITDELN